MLWFVACRPVGIHVGRVLLLPVRRLAQVGHAKRWLRPQQHSSGHRLQLFLHLHVGECGLRLSTPCLPKLHRAVVALEKPRQPNTGEQEERTVKSALTEPRALAAPFHGRGKNLWLGRLSSGLLFITAAHGFQSCTT